MSSTGLLGLLVLLALLGLTVISVGFRRAQSAVSDNGQAAGNPLVLAGGSCSAVISARCHATEHERNSKFWQRQLTWGVVDGGQPANVAHCTFTAGRARDIDPDRSYA
jgi:hypothetical protein